MAGRPVTVQGSSSGLLWGLIALAFVSVAALTLFIVQLTQNRKLVNTAADAERRISTYGAPPSYYATEARNRNSRVFAVMEDDLERIANRVTGIDEDVAPTIIEKSEQTLGRIAARLPGSVKEGDTLLPSIERLAQLLTDARSAQAAAEARASQLQSERDNLTEQLRVTREQFESEVAKLGGRLESIQAEATSSIEQKDAQLADLQTALDSAEQQVQQLRREGTVQARETEIELRRLQNEAARLRQEVANLRPGSFDPSAILKKADGRVVRAIPGSDVVYVNLGAVDRVKPGLKFELFSQTQNVSSGLRGKASVEVVTVMENAAECRVTRREYGQPILEGDLVVNIAFERSRKPKFVVRGEFDLDFDGTADFDGREQVLSLIRQWGGQVVDELDESVDFLVVGLRPGERTLAVDEAVTDVVRDQLLQQAYERSQFRDLVDRAWKIGVPVLNQNQFLFLTGYSGHGPAGR
jgi:hypothetical protein